MSYYNLLGNIYTGNIPDEVILKLNCGSRTYKAEYDGGEFQCYILKNQKDEDENFHFYLSETMLESQMFDNCLTFINKPKILLELDDEISYHNLYKNMEALINNQKILMERVTELENRY